MVCGKNPPPLLTRALVFRSPLVLLVGLFQEISAASQYTGARRGKEYAQSRGGAGGCALDEVGLVGAGCVDGRGLGGGLLAAGQSQVDATEQGGDGANGKLEREG